MDARTCRDCGEAFPLTPDHFHRDAGNPSGFRNNCKPCQSAKVRKCQPKGYRRKPAAPRAVTRPAIARPAVVVRAPVVLSPPDQRPFEIELSAPFFALHRVPSLAELCMPTGAEYDARKAA